GKYAPWVMDMASSVAARGHIRLSEKTNTPIPEGWALDSDGNSTTDPHEAMKGVMVPFAGPKGSAIAMLVDILGGVLSGSSFAGNIRDMNKDFTAPQGVGHFFLALKIEAFMPLNDFYARMEEQIERLHKLAPAPGFKNVLYPGEPEAKVSECRAREGIPLNETVLTALRELSLEAGLDFPHSISQ
ncbi:MAG: Ldh family oxidoreductase, partial [Natronospirillum sp.]